MAGLGCLVIKFPKTWNVFTSQQSYKLPFQKKNDNTRTQDKFEVDFNECKLSDPARELGSSDSVLVSEIDFSIIAIWLILSYFRITLK